MITKQRQLFYFVGDKPYASLAEAQVQDLASLVPDHLVSLMPEENRTAGKSEIARWMVKGAAIVDTLTTTPRSRTRARKTNGAKRTRKPKLQPAVTAPA